MPKCPNIKMLKWQHETKKVEPTIYKHPPGTAKSWQRNKSQRTQTAKLHTTITSPQNEALSNEHITTIQGPWCSVLAPHGALRSFFRWFHWLVDCIGAADMRDLALYVCTQSSSTRAGNCMMFLPEITGGSSPAQSQAGKPLPRLSQNDVSHARSTRHSLIPQY